MSGYFTRLLSAQSGFGTTAPACGCARSCTCPAGQACSCGQASRCQSAAARPAHTDLWAEAGESEGENEVRRRPMVTRALASMPGRGLPPSQQQQQRPPSSLPVVRPYPPLPARRVSLQMDRARQLMRRQRLNQDFATRFGWGGHMHHLGRMLGCGACAPGSLQFMLAVARWQRRLGLRPTGVLGPALLWRLPRPIPVPVTVPGVPLAAPPAPGSAGGPSSSGGAPAGPTVEAASDDGALPVPVDGSAAPGHAGDASDINDEPMPDEADIDQFLQQLGNQEVENLGIRTGMRW